MNRPLQHDSLRYEGTERAGYVLKLFASVLLASVAAAPAMGQVTSEWNFTGVGNWTNPGNWIGAVPNNASATALFGTAVTNNSTAVVNANITIGQITFNNSVRTYSVSASGANTLNLAGVATINVLAGSHNISAPIVGLNGLTKSGPGTVTLSGTNTYSGNTNMTAGTLIVQNQTIPGQLINVAAGATLRANQFVFYELRPDQTLSGSGDVFVVHTFSDTELFVAPTSAVRGSLALHADQIVNSGRIAPGFSPGILKIDGDFTQESDGVLEIEVGGLTPGTQHDQVQVTGSASLGGRLEVPIINSFAPALNNEITFLTSTDEVSGTFSSVLAPNLAAVNPSLAMRVIYGAGDVRLRFVAPSLAVQFNADVATADWHDTGSWIGGLPGTSHVISVTNLAGVDQRVDVESANAFTHTLSVVGNQHEIIVGVKGGLNLTAMAGVTIGNNGAIELDGGNLVSAAVSVGAGGRLSGNGVVVGDLTVGSGVGPPSALLSPGFSVGHFAVEGDYLQGDGGQLLIEVEGDEPGEFDSIDVLGKVEPGGTLIVDASNFDGVTPGTSVPIITAANGVVPGLVFDSVQTAGPAELYFAPTYAPGQVLVTSFLRGDMNRDGMLNGGDVNEFALALTNPVAYFDLRFVEGSQSGNMDGSNGLDFDDIDEFADALELAGVANALAAIERALAAVPEPGTMALAIFWAVGGLAIGRNRRRSDAP